MSKVSIIAKKGRGTLVILSFLFIFSAGIRIFLGAEQVFAAVTPNEEKPNAVKEEASPVTASDAKLDATLKAFQEREERVQLKERQIERRMKALRIIEEEVDQKLEQLKAAETELRQTLSLASTAAEDDLTRLTAVYENMKPKTAAALFEEMAPDFAAGFLGRMKPETAAAIMAGMKPGSAYTISAILAGRNANVPKN